MRARVVGITLEPDVLAFPLASRPRIYVPAAVAQERLGLDDRATALAIWARSRSRVPELLVQARTQSYGLTGLELTTRASVRANVGAAAGIVLALLAAFAVMALAAAAAMLAASAQARVLRDRGTLGTLRAIGAAPAVAAASYAFEAALLAVPALALGVGLATWLADAPTARLLGLLNELPPPALGWPQAAVVAGGALVSATAAFLPALLTAREPPLRLLRDVPPAAGHGRVAARPLTLGARLAAARPLRLAVTAGVLAMAAGLVLLMLGLGRFLLDVQRDPAVLGDRFALAVDGGRDVLQTVRSTPGVAAGVLRWQTTGADAFDLREPVTLVALGRGGEDYRLPLISGRRAGPGEAEIGAGLADALGIRAGGRLLAELPDGGQVSVPVAGVVRELSHDGRVAYVPPADLLGAAPRLRPQVAVALESGAGPDEVTRRLAARGLEVVAARGSASDATELVDAVVLLLRLVAVIDGLVCAGLLALAVATVVRERAATVAVVRTVGARPGQVRLLVAGIAAAYLAIALPAAVVLEELLLGPAVSRLVGRYGELPLGVSAGDALLVVAVAVALAAGVAWWLTARLLATPVRPLLQGR
jgi:ABC-type lipoprotein release transport system permease subunit